MLTSRSEECTPAGIVDRIGVDSPAAQCEFDTPELGQTQVATLAHHLDPQLLAVDADRVIGAVTDILVAFAAGLHVGADAAVPEQFGRRQQDGLEQFIGRQRLGGNAQRLARGLGELDLLGAARPDAAAGGNQLGVVVGPGRAPKFEQPLALGETAGRVRVRVYEDVAVVKGRQQLDLLGQQHAVAEHVAGHIAHADHGEGLGLDVLAHFAEVALDAFPGAARGDAHLLVVIAGRTAGGEGVAQPVAVGLGHRIGDIRKGRRALVGGDHQIGVVIVIAHYRLGRHDLRTHAVVGDVQQALQEGLVAVDTLRQPGFAIGRVHRLLDHEPALGAHRHDHRVLDHLRLHQAQHLGAEILAPVRPAQPAARHLAAAQMDALDLG